MLSLAVEVSSKKKIVEELQRTLKDLKECAELLREWSKTQKHFPEVPSTNLIEFVIVNNKFSIEQAKQKLDMFYTIRSKIPEVFDNKNPKFDRMKDSLDAQLIIPFPKLLDDKYRVIFLKLKKNHEAFEPFAQISMLVNVYEIRAQEDLVLSDIVLFDLENLSMNHIYKSTLMPIKVAATILEKVYSNRVKLVHVINYPPIFELLLKLVKAVLKPKLYNRIRFHGSIESLTKCIPLDILPKDYGGNERSLDDLENLWKEKLIEYADHFDKLDTLRVNESLRPSPMKDIEKFGLQGTFRKLSID